MENHKKTICFIHYGIGWRDGINTVIKSLADQIQKQEPNLGLHFLGGRVKEHIIEGASYQEIPELLPQDNNQIKENILEQAQLIAQKIAQATKGIDTVVIENPLMGDYHLAAMFGFFIFANEHKAKETKVFFRIHDFYLDAPHYYQKLKDLFSSQEIKGIMQSKGVNGFLIINHNLRQKLISQGVPDKKIFYLPNGVNSEVFNTNISKEETKQTREKIGISKEEKLLLYPVRVIPRKNIEEAILLIHFIRQITNRNYVLMVSGKVDKYDPLSEGYYQILKKIRKLAGFPVIFNRNSHSDPFPLRRKHNKEGKIERFSISDIYQISEAIIMTSLREGFGYPFLECWFTKKIIIGRRIQNVIKDFEKSGLSFEWLYKDFLLDNDDSINIEDEKNFKRAKRVLDIFKDEKLKKQILELNKDDILKQIEILKNKEEREKIIESNFKVAENTYSASKISNRFLELIGINERNKSKSN